MPSPRSRRWIGHAAGISAAAAALQSAPANAAENGMLREYISPLNVGFFLGMSFGHGVSFAYGGDVRFGTAGITPFLRAEGRGIRFARFTLGATAAPTQEAIGHPFAPIGELGWSYLTGSTQIGTTWSSGPHLGLGWGGLSAQVLSQGTIPVVGDRSHYDFNLSFVTVQPQFMTRVLAPLSGHGRPLHIDGELAFPDLIAVGLTPFGRPRVAGAAALARAWGEDARAEAASVPAFERLAFELAALGAPAHLIEWALRSADEEVEHTERCTQLASRWSGVEVRAAPIEAAPRWVRPSREAFATLAREAWEDGILNEGAAALSARKAVLDCTDVQSRDTQLAIAQEEARHAELSWAVLDWVWRAGGSAARDAVMEAVESYRAPVLQERTDVDLDFFRAHGRVSAADESASAIETQDRAFRRLQRLTRNGRPVV